MQLEMNLKNRDMAAFIGENLAITLIKVCLTNGKPLLWYE